MTQRRLARECALETLYRFELVGDDPEATIEELLARKNPSQEAESYLRRLVGAVREHQPEVDRVLRRHLRRWRLERVTVLDRQILRMAAVELLFFEDVPPKAAINEAVELARKFDDDRAGAFVNGVLDGVYHEVVSKTTVKDAGGR